MAQQVRRCKAIRDYAAKSDAELSFQEGDIIMVPFRANDANWCGVFKGKTGLFPK